MDGIKSEIRTLPVKVHDDDDDDDDDDVDDRVYWRSLMMSAPLANEPHDVEYFDEHDGIEPPR